MDAFLFAALMTATAACLVLAPFLHPKLLGPMLIMVGISYLVLISQFTFEPARALNVIWWIAGGLCLTWTGGSLTLGWRKPAFVGMCLMATWFLYLTRLGSITQVGISVSVLQFLWIFAWRRRITGTTQTAG